MKNRLSILLICLIAVGSMFFYSIPSFATEDVLELKNRIKALQKRVEELETEQKEKKLFFSPINRSQKGFGFRWNPFDEMDRMQEKMNRIFQNSFSMGGLGQRGMLSNSMSYDYDFDIKESKDEYEIRFDIKGFAKDKIDLEINKHSITVKGEHSSQDTEENQNSYFSSQSFGSFMKTIPLPVDADTTKVKTEKEGDALVIRLPKRNT